MRQNTWGRDKLEVEFGKKIKADPAGPYRWLTFGKNNAAPFPPTRRIRGDWVK